MEDLKYGGNLNNLNDLQKFVGKTISAILPVIDNDGIGYDGDVKSVWITFTDGDRLNISGTEEDHIAFFDANKTN